MLLRPLTFSYAVFLLKRSFQFTNEIARCLHNGSVFFVIPNFPIERCRKRYAEIERSVYNIMMAFIINSSLDSNITEQFAISGKKQVNT